MKLVFPDTETTGLDRQSDEIIELAALRVDWPSWRVDGVYYRRFAPYGPVPHEAAAINGYTPEAWAGAERVTTADLLEFRDFVAGCRWIGSMPQFDFDFIERARMARGVDPFVLASRRLWCVNSLASPLTFAARVEKGGLDELCSVLGIDGSIGGAVLAPATHGRIGPHTAMGDALRCTMVLRRLLSGYLAPSVIAAILGEGEAAKGGEHVTEEELAEVDLDAANLADPTYGAANFARRQGAEERLARRAPRLTRDLRAERSRREDAEMRLAELRAEIEAMRRGGSR